MLVEGLYKVFLSMDSPFLLLHKQQTSEFYHEQPEVFQNLVGTIIVSFFWFICAKNAQISDKILFFMIHFSIHLHLHFLRN